MPNIPTIPLASWIDKLVDGLTQFEGFFNVITNIIGGIVDAFQWVFDLVPPWLFIILLVFGTFWVNRKGKKWGLIIFEVVGLLLIWNLDFWRDMTQTLTLVLTSSLIALVIGVPLGIWMAKSNIVESIFKPVLDYANYASLRLLNSCRSIFRNWNGSRGCGFCYFRNASNCSYD